MLQMDSIDLATMSVDGCNLKRSEGSRLRKSGVATKLGSVITNLNQSRPQHVDIWSLNLTKPYSKKLKKHHGKRSVYAA